jgi:hypothetical protein
MRDLNFSTSKDLRLFFKTEKFDKIFVVVVRHLFISLEQKNY